MRLGDEDLEPEDGVFVGKISPDAEAAKLKDVDGVVIHVTLKGSASSGWYSPPRGTHTGEKHRSVGSGRAKPSGERRARGSGFGTSDVTDESKLGILEKGVNDSMILEFADGTKGIFKPEDMAFGSVECEILAYEFSKSIGWDLVPETIVYEHAGVRGSLQKWVDNAQTYADYDGPMEDVAGTHPTFMKIAVMDGVLQQMDRHDANWLIDSGQELWAIDNGGAFGVGFLGARESYTPYASWQDTTGWKELKSWAKTPKATAYAAQIGDMLGAEHEDTFRQFLDIG